MFISLFISLLYHEFLVKHRESGLILSEKQYVFIFGEWSLLGGCDNNEHENGFLINESLFWREHNREMLLNEQWYLSGFVWLSNKIFMIAVPNRNSKPIDKVLSEIV